MCLESGEELNENFGCLRCPSGGPHSPRNSALHVATCDGRVGSTVPPQRTSCGESEWKLDLPRLAPSSPAYPEAGGSILCIFIVGVYVRWPATLLLVRRSKSARPTPPEPVFVDKLASLWAHRPRLTTTSKASQLLQNEMQLSITKQFCLYWYVSPDVCLLFHLKC